MTQHTEQQHFPTREEFARELDLFEREQGRVPHSSRHDRFRYFLVAFALIAAWCLVVAVAVLT